MNFKKIVGFGVILWILMFVIVSVFIAFKIANYTWMQVITAIIAGVLSWLLAKKNKLIHVGQALLCGLIFVIVGLILDMIVTVRFNPNIFSSWSLWLGYLLVLLAPLLTIKKAGALVSSPPAGPTVPPAV